METITTTQERSRLPRKILTSLWITAGLATVAVLGYGGDCTGEEGTVGPVDKVSDAATGYLLHSVPGNPRLFSCQYRCMATLISWNVIATSRSCLEFYQAQVEHKTRDNFDHQDHNWAFGAPSNGGIDVCPNKSDKDQAGDDPSTRRVYDPVEAKLYAFYDKKEAWLQAQGRNPKYVPQPVESIPHTGDGNTATPSLYRVWRTRTLPDISEDYYKKPENDIRNRGDLVLMVLSRPVSGIQPYELPAPGETPNPDHGKKWKYEDPEFRLLAYTQKGLPPMQVGFKITATTTETALPDGADSYLSLSTAKPKPDGVQKKISEKSTYSRVHHGETCGASGKTYPALSWVYPDWRDKVHRTLNDVDTSSVASANNDNFVNTWDAIGFMGSPILRGRRVYGVLAGYGNSWNARGCGVSPDYRSLEAGFSFASGFGGVIVGLAASFIIEFALGAFAPVALPALGALGARAGLGGARKLSIRNWGIWGRAPRMPPIHPGLGPVHPGLPPVHLHPGLGPVPPGLGPVHPGLPPVHPVAPAYPGFQFKTGLSGPYLRRKTGHPDWSNTWTAPLTPTTEESKFIVLHQFPWPEYKYRNPYFYDPFAPFPDLPGPAIPLRPPRAYESLHKYEQRLLQKQLDYLNALDEWKRGGRQGPRPSSIASTNDGAPDTFGIEVGADNAARPELPQAESSAIGHYRGEYEKHLQSLEAYNEALARHNTAMGDYAAGLANHNKTVATYDEALANYNTAVANYNTALANHHTAVTNYNTALANHNAAVTNYNAGMAAYMTAQSADLGKSLLELALGGSGALAGIVAATSTSKVRAVPYTPVMKDHYPVVAQYVCWAEVGIEYATRGKLQCSHTTKYMGYKPTGSELSSPNDLGEWVPPIPNKRQIQAMLGPAKSSALEPRRRSRTVATSGEPAGAIGAVGMGVPALCMIGAIGAVRHIGRRRTRFGRRGRNSADSQCG